MAGREDIGMVDLFSNACVGPAHNLISAKNQQSSSAMCNSRCNVLKKMAFKSNKRLTAAQCEEAGKGFHGAGCSLCKDSDAKMCYETAEDFCESFNRPKYLNSVGNKTIEFQPFLNVGCEGTCRDKCAKVQRAFSGVSKKQGIENCLQKLEK